MLSDGLNVWLSKGFDISILQASVPLCKMFKFFNNILRQLSIITILMMSLEKLFAVLNPIQTRQQATRRRVLKKFVLAFLICLTLNSHNLFTYSLVALNDKSIENKTINSLSVCMNNKWSSFNYVISVIDFVTFSIFPSIFLIISNMLIARVLVRETKIRSKLNSSKPSIARFVVIKSKIKSEVIPGTLIKRLSTPDKSKNFNLKNTHGKRLTLPSFSNKHCEKKLKSASLGMLKINYSCSILNSGPKIDKSCINIEDPRRRKLEIRLDSENKIIYEINDLAINPNVFENHKFKRKNQIQSNIRLQFYDENNCKNKSSLIIKFLLISISFCLMSIPIEIIKMIHNCNSDYFILFKTVSELLQYLSHSVNFLLYCISGKSLREEVKRFLKCFK